MSSSPEQVVFAIRLVCSVQFFYWSVEISFGPRVLTQSLCIKWTDLKHFHCPVTDSFQDLNLLHANQNITLKNMIGNPGKNPEQ